MTTMFEVTNTIPVPGRSSGSGRKSKYPFKTMHVGDSFFVPGIRKTSLYQAAKMAGKKEGRKFTVRATVEKGLFGARAWRTA